MVAIERTVSSCVPTSYFPSPLYCLYVCDWLLRKVRISLNATISQFRLARSAEGLLVLTVLGYLVVSVNPSVRLQ